MTKSSKIFLSIFLVGMALAGLIGVQIYWAYYTYQLTEKEFARHVNEVLKKTSKEINESFVAYETFSKVRLQAHEGFYILKQKWQDDTFLDPKINPVDTIPIYYNHTNKEHEFEWKHLMFSHPVTISMVFQYHYLPEKDTSYGFSNSFEKVTLYNYRETFSEGKSVEERYPPKIIDSLIKKNLNAAFIQDDYSFGYIDKEDNRIAYSHYNTDSLELLNSRFKVLLTPSDYFSKPLELSVIFTNYSDFIFSALNKLLLLSILIIFILLFTFFLFIRTVLKQRKLSELKNDFINNMTHEFKTPLTNISLALESLTVQKLIKEEKGEKMIKIVSQESERLRENIERILQISRYEKEKLHLSKDRIDIHQLIKKVIEVFEPIFHEVEIKDQLLASQFIVYADEMHIFNMLYNIIDNAIKYTIQKPIIMISTRNLHNGMLIVVKDNGIGISSAHQKNIFEKFYRVQYHNVHDVKGYGLGLSYVKLIVDSHYGYIKVNSQPGKGSEFEVFIPDIL